MASRGAVRFFSAAIVGTLPLLASGCGELRGGPLDPAGDDAGARDGGEGEDDALVADVPLANLAQVPDLPHVDYRAVFARTKDHVIIVGDSTILEKTKTGWNGTPVGGVELSGVWADETIGFAVGTMKNTNRGVIMMRDAHTWIQFATVEHGLRDVWGDGDFRVATGHDGVVYQGFGDVPFGSGYQLDAADEAPSTLFSPIVWSVGGNSKNHVVAAGSVATFFHYTGAEWKGNAEVVDPTRSYRSVWGPKGTELDVVLGANYYGLWRFRGSRYPNGERRHVEMFNEERDDVARSNQYINRIWGESTSRFIAVGTGGRLMTFDGGRTKVLATVAGARDLWGISGTSTDDVWVVGNDGVVLHGSVPIE